MPLDLTWIVIEQWLVTFMENMNSFEEFVETLCMLNISCCLSTSITLLILYLIMSIGTCAWHRIVFVQFVLLMFYSARLLTELLCLQRLYYCMYECHICSDPLLNSVPWDIHTTQQIRRQELWCRRATCLEQSSGPLARRWHYIRQFQAWTQNVLF